MAYINNRSANRVISKELRSHKMLKEMSVVIPRDSFVKLIEGTYTRNTPINEGGRPRVKTIVMIKMYFLSLWYNLSDELAEEHIYDRSSFQQFLDIDITSEQIPDATTLCRFRKHMNESK